MFHISAASEMGIYFWGITSLLYFANAIHIHLIIHRFREEYKGGEREFFERKVKIPAADTVGILYSFFVVFGDRKPSRAEASLNDCADDTRACVYAYDPRYHRYEHEDANGCACARVYGLYLHDGVRVYAYARARACAAIEPYPSP